MSPEMCAAREAVDSICTATLNGVIHLHDTGQLPSHPPRFPDILSRLSGDSMRHWFPNASNVASYLLAQPSTENHTAGTDGETYHAPVTNDDTDEGEDMHDDQLADADAESANDSYLSAQISAASETDDVLLIPKQRLDPANTKNCMMMSMAVVLSPAENMFDLRINRKNLGALNDYYSPATTNASTYSISNTLPPESLPIPGIPIREAKKFRANFDKIFANFTIKERKKVVREVRTN
ncbi:hypothetical protein GGX14DRAFT_395718 [Mycena pura]|uniref:Uncharacterized protein n=1 Tax=Mycena pura TaxID=153505 RepID=A0AAD6VC12_9AGAR|nr:hypothetical protein GGX14DRAFT_395718 [Mycena pura]